MTTLIFPIGHCLGTLFFGGDPDKHVHQVRLGSEIVELTDSEFVVWSLAHGLADEQAPTPWDRARVEHACADSNIANAGELIELLLGKSLLVEVAVDGPTAADFARQHRLLPLHLGLGNSAEYNALFAAGTTEHALVGMSRTLYELWLSAHLAPNLLAACEDRLAREAIPEVPDPVQLLAATLTAMHSLLAPSAACLDLAVPEYQP